MKDEAVAKAREKVTAIVTENATALVKGKISSKKGLIIIITIDIIVIITIIITTNYWLILRWNKKWKEDWNKAINFKRGYGDTNKASNGYIEADTTPQD